MELEYLVVGQGIAGTILSHSLLKANKKILVIDEVSDNSSSKIAAGLYNPIVFKRIVKSWMVDGLLSQLEKVYSDLEELLNQQFHFRKDIAKLFSSQKEMYLWLKKSELTDISSYISSELFPPFHANIIQNPLGYGVVKAGYVKVYHLLTFFQNFLESKKILRKEKFQYADLQVKNDGIKWKEYSAKKIIFCDGYKAVYNPFFSWLPFVLTKGEILTIVASGLPDERIIHKNIFILPLGKGIFKVGATYNWNQMDEVPSENGRIEIINKLNAVLKVPYKIIEHKAGIRPTVKDRRPFLGVHPKYESVAIFNGMGTKGVMLAPYFANELYLFLEHGKPLHKEVNIDRYYHLYKPTYKC